MYWLAVGQSGDNASLVFYQRLTAFSGDAPDQFRLLPWLVLGGIQKVGVSVLSGWPFKFSLLIFWLVSAFGCFEMGWFFLKKPTPGPSTEGRGAMDSKRNFPLSSGEGPGVGFPQNILIFNGLFAILHPLTQVFGWKPDTLFCHFFCLAAACFFFEKRVVAGAISLGLLAFCRADVALFYGLFVAIYGGLNWPVRALVVGFPIVVQLVLQRVVFPDAHYYVNWFQLPENLKCWRLFIHPFTWLIMAAGLIFRKEIQSFFNKNGLRWRWAFWLMAGWIVLVFVVARVNEWRLFWPFLPLLMWIQLSGKNENSARRTI